MPTTETRITVSLTVKSVAALEAITAVTGDTKTDTVNRAIQLYRLYLDESGRGAKLVLSQPDGTVETIRVL